MLPAQVAERVLQHPDRRREHAQGEENAEIVEYALQHADPICVLWSTRFHMAHARPISGSISGRIARSIRVEYGAPGGDITDRAACWLVCGPGFREIGRASGRDRVCQYV